MEKTREIKVSDYGPDGFGVLGYDSKRQKTFGIFTEDLYEAGYRLGVRVIEDQSTHHFEYLLESFETEDGHLSKDQIDQFRGAYNDALEEWVAAENQLVVDRKPKPPLL